jgi:hypothetical protein
MNILQGYLIQIDWACGFWLEEINKYNILEEKLCGTGHLGKTHNSGR